MYYNYLEAVTEDAKSYIEENYTAEEIREMFEDRYNWECTLCDDMWTADSVTGNASGSYTFNTYQAEEYICHNLDILAEAVEEWGGNMDVLKSGFTKAGVKAFERDTVAEIFSALEETNRDFTIEELYIKISIGDKYITLPTYAEIFDALTDFLITAEEENRC